MGDPAAFSRPKAAGAQPVRASENSMREETYSAAFAPERAAVSTTNVIMCGAAGIPAWRHTAAQQQCGTDCDENYDRHHFDHGEPVLEPSVVSYTAKIHQQQHSGKTHHPKQCGHGRKPIRHVGCGGY